MDGRVVWTRWLRLQSSPHASPTASDSVRVSVAAGSVDTKACSLRGTSFKNKVSTKAKIPKGTATRNTALREWLKAWTQPAWIGGGSALICAGFEQMLLPEMWRSAEAGRYFGSSAESLWLNMLPKRATPNAPPIERKKVAERRRDAQLVVGDGVLDGDHEHLHDESHAEAEHDHVDRGDGSDVVGVRATAGTGRWRSSRFR